MITLKSNTAKKISINNLVTREWTSGTDNPTITYNVNKGDVVVVIGYYFNISTTAKYISQYKSFSTDVFGTIVYIFESSGSATFTWYGTYFDGAPVILKFNLYE